MILQTCVSEPSVRSLAVAIGALGKTHSIFREWKQQRNLDCVVIPSPGEITPAQIEHVSDGTTGGFKLHHRNALQQYEKAIRRLRRDLSAGRQSIRTTLISCIIIVVFEQLHGNNESATAHLLSGLRLMKEWKEIQRDESKHPLGFSSPAPDVVEDFLVQTFGRLDIQAISHIDRRPVEEHRKLKHHGSEIIRAMPHRFTCIEEARIYLDLAMRRQMHFLASIINYSKVSFTDPKTGEEIEYSEDWMFSKLSPPDLYTPSDHIEHQAHSTDLTTWMTAFQPTLTRSMNLGGKERISALSMMIAALATRTNNAAAFTDTEMAWDEYRSDFATVVKYSRVLLETLEEEKACASPGLMFSFDLGVLAPLYITITKCRDREVRQDAIELLLKYPRREGIWHSAVTAAFGRWLVRLEEEGVVDVDGNFEIPEEKRVRNSSLTYHKERKVIIMKCLQRDVESGKLILREETCWAPTTLSGMWDA